MDELLGFDVITDPRPTSGVDLIATYNKFFHDQKWKKKHGLSVLNKLRKILFPLMKGMTGVDAAVEMTPNDYRRDRIQPILDDYYRYGERDTDRERLVYYLSTILFGQYPRREGEVFEGMAVKERLQLLGIQTSISWVNLEKEDFFKFVNEDGNPQDEEMRWSVVIPSFHVLRLEHLSGVRVWDDIYPKNENGVNADYVKAVLGRWQQRFQERSKELPYMTYPGGPSRDQIASIFCEDALFEDEMEDEMEDVNSKERRSQMVRSLLVRQSFPKLPWEERPEWLPWVYPWPNRWKKQDPFVPIPGKSTAYNAGAERVYSNPEFSNSVIPTIIDTDQEVIDYCRGILEARLDENTQRVVFPGGRVFAQKKALQYRFLLNTLDAEKYDTALEAYVAARFYSTTATISKADFGKLYTRVLDSLKELRPSAETMIWVRGHVKEILQIFFDMNNEVAKEYEKEISKAESIRRWPFNLLHKINEEEDQQAVENAIAIALREYGPETHVIRYEGLLPEAERISGEILRSSPESSLEESIEESIEESFEEPPDLEYDQLRFRIVEEVENSFESQTKTWVYDRTLNEKDKSYLDLVFQEVKEKLWKLSSKPESTWGRKLMKFPPAWGMRVTFLLGIITQIELHKIEFSEEGSDDDVFMSPAHQPPEDTFNWEFFRP